MKLILKKYLKEKDISVYWLMKETGISQKGIYDLVNNKTDGIKFDTLGKICSALNCTPNDLLEHLPKK
ncbi:helix-turn-helix domain-containing protein [Sporomusa acidovorans]|uniref:HTH cro/C1-type domain-containing protein n=1 Tax=Sporomusa acidovorans (strain ATCC 49682 / DSM 3132 / Mol) TaxID=1123286 RepID=A0ABZ3IYU7_SPOA4|nr:helix-turn-helix transcriptional regulator [Sporomusa acidovorans]OZC16808.1 helix-turn-helix domain protein [Sporomusa acidovorans DSM 3132]SDF79182.1 putative transcriptional regulator [Sporomusa acidovorans]